MGAIRAALLVLAVGGLFIFLWVVAPTLADDRQEAFAPDVNLGG